MTGFFFYNRHFSFENLAATVAITLGPTLSHFWDQWRSSFGCPLPIHLRFTAKAFWLSLLKPRISCPTTSKLKKLKYVHFPKYHSFLKIFGGHRSFLLCHWYPGFTCGATPADLLAISMATEFFWSIYLWTSIDGTQVRRCLTAWDKTDALRTVLCWLGLNIILNFSHISLFSD